MDAGRKFVSGLAGKNPHPDDLANFSGRNVERGVTHIPGFIAKDRPQKFFFRRQFGLAFRCNFPNQNIIWADVGSNYHNSVFA